MNRVFEACGGTMGFVLTALLGGAAAGIGWFITNDGPKLVVNVCSGVVEAMISATGAAIAVFSR